MLKITNPKLYQIHAQIIIVIPFESEQKKEAVSKRNSRQPFFIHKYIDLFAEFQFREKQSIKDWTHAAHFFRL